MSCKGKKKKKKARRQAESYLRRLAASSQVWILQRTCAIEDYRAERDSVALRSHQGLLQCQIHGMVSSLSPDPQEPIFFQGRKGKDTKVANSPLAAGCWLPSHSQLLPWLCHREWPLEATRATEREKLIK